MSVLLLHGDARTLPLANASVHCVVTSPPYYGLRDYGTATWEGGEKACTHVRIGARDTRPRSGLMGGLKTVNHAQEPQWRAVCGRCAAVRVDQQLGLEASPEAYVAALVATFREVKRVLRDDGCLFLNLGDSYNAAGRRGHGTRVGVKQGTNRASATGQDWPRSTAAMLGEKQLLGMPWRVAFGLQADGWILRSAITLCKTAPMPESVKDRPTSATEMLFLFAKQSAYYYDAEAIRTYGGSGWRGSSFTSQHDVATKAGLGQQARVEHHGRNAWNYWMLAPEPTANGHYASFPPSLVRRCLLAGCPRQVCTQCSRPWVRQVSRQRLLDGHIPVSGTFAKPDEPFRIPPNGIGHYRYTTQTTDLGFVATCACEAPTRKARILDPFAGSGTVGLVARELGHDAVCVDLSMPYLRDIARERLGLAALERWTRGYAPPPTRYDDLPLFAEARA
jgi:DNA methylase